MDRARVLPACALKIRECQGTTVLDLLNQAKHANGLVADGILSISILSPCTFLASSSLIVFQMLDLTNIVS